MSEENLEFLNNLTEKEKETIKVVMAQISNTGKSEELENIYYEDYEEIPVDIETFLFTDKYLGRYTNYGIGFFETWTKELKYVHNPNNFVDQWAITGSTGTGKSTVATLSIAYELYKLMCMKDPNLYYLGSHETIWILFFNLNLKLAERTMWGKLQKALQMSPWFMERGTVNGRTNLIYQPNKDIRLGIGSTEEHALSIAVMYCLEGDTEILTENGYIKIKDLQNKKIRVYTQNDDGTVILTKDPVKIEQTGITNKLIEIQLENDYIFRCTPNHKLRLKNGQYKEAQYLNLDDELEDVNTEIGIYMLKNKLNNKVYIGQSKQLSIRKNQHYNNPKNLILEDIGDHDIKDVVEFSILENCTEDLLDEREQYYITKYNSLYPNGYNRQTGGRQDFTYDEDMKKTYDTFTNASEERRNQVYQNWNTNVKNRFWYNNGKDNVYIHPEEFKLYEEKGYKKGRLLNNKSKNGLIFVYNIKTWDVKQIKPSELDKYKAKGYNEGLLRKNGYIWLYKDMQFKSAKKLALYLVSHGYPEINRHSVEHIMIGNYTGIYQNLIGQITCKKAIDLYNLYNGGKH